MKSVRAAAKIEKMLKFGVTSGSQTWSQPALGSFWRGIRPHFELPRRQISILGPAHTRKVSLDILLDIPTDKTFRQCVKSVRAAAKIRKMLKFGIPVVN